MDNKMLSLDKSQLRAEWLATSRHSLSNIVCDLLIGQIFIAYIVRNVLFCVMRSSDCVSCTPRPFVDFRL